MARIASTYPSDAPLFSVPFKLNHLDQKKILQVIQSSLSNAHVTSMDWKVIEQACINFLNSEATVRQSPHLNASFKYLSDLEQALRRVEGLLQDSRTAPESYSVLTKLERKANEIIDAAPYSPDERPELRIEHFQSKCSVLKNAISNTKNEIASTSDKDANWPFANFIENLENFAIGAGLKISVRKDDMAVSSFVRFVAVVCETLPSNFRPSYNSLEALASRIHGSRKRRRLLREK